MAEKRAEYQVLKEGMEEVLRIDANKWSYLPSIEDNALVMAGVIDLLAEVPSIGRIIFNQKRNYSYDSEQTAMLVEIAGVYNHLIRDKKIFSLGFNEKAAVLISEKVAALQYLLFNLLRSDPLGTYVEVKRFLREEKINLDKENDNAVIEVRTNYINVLNYILELLKKTRMIRRVVNELEGYILGDRSLYKNLFRVVITPDFMFTRLMANPPLDGEELDAYSVGENEINIYSVPGDIKCLYHVVPPEFKLTEDKYNLLDLARGVLAEHKPRQEEFLDPGRMRQTFFNIGRDLLQELAQHKDIELNFSEIEELAKILVRYTVGFGLIEVLLRDPKIQDVVVNAPIGRTPAFIVHQEYGECVTNIIPAREDGESWASKFRILSGRPLDEANPVLDTELLVPGARARVAIISEPLSPSGLAYSLRRHRDMPWTLPLFIENKMIDSLGAGLLSFLVDGAKTLLVGGSRSSGKTSFLGALLVEIMRKYRIITLEDTKELPVDVLRELGYNIQSMKVRSALMTGGAEMGADEGIRTSLRMGDSCLIVGEIRSSIRGNEEVLIIENGVTKRVQIKDLEGKDISNIYVPSMDFDLKFKLKKLIAFIKHPKRKKLLEITTRTGRKIVVTPDHSLFTNKNFHIIPIECCNLKIGDKIIIPNKLPCGYADISSIDIAKFLNIPIEKPMLFNLMNEKKASLYLENFIIKKIRSNKTFLKEIEINDDFCRFLGYYLSEGYCDKNSVVITNSDQKIIRDIVNISTKLFKINPYIREVTGLGKAFEISIRNSILKEFIIKLCGRVSKEKRIPSFVYGLNERKICAFLKGLYSGDGNFTANIKKSNNIIGYFSSNKKLAEDVMYLLLTVGIVARFRELNSKTTRGMYAVEFQKQKYIKEFLDKINFVNHNNKVPVKMSYSRSALDIVNFDIGALRDSIKKLPREYRTLRQRLRCGKDYLKRLTEKLETEKTIYQFSHGEFFIDEIKSVKKINLKEEEYVYDLSIEPCQNFVGGFGGILLHNTEAKALYEAMRIGSMSNVVAGTLHGADPYSIFDRVVNDLGVPRTSFKATDIIVVANPIKSPDGLHSWKRILQIAEVRKHWEEDPLRERGFVDLMKYNPQTDKLEPSDDLINGDSEVLKSVASNIKEWAGDWDAVWENILLRAKIKQALVDYSKKLDDKSLLEADFVVNSNDAFHKIGDSVREEVGGADNKRIYFEWEDWLKRKIREREL